MDSTPTHHPYHKASREEDILVHFSDHTDGHYANSTAHSAVRRALTKRSSRSSSARVTREKSRKRDFLNSTRPGITVDTNFTRHKGNRPHEVSLHDDIYSGSSIRKQSWFNVRRYSTKNKGLGITKGTPQPGYSHRANPSVDTNDLQTAISLTPGTQPWQDVSPWDQRIPIGISVPTESISDFGSYQMPRHRSGSDATLVTPNIIITPAEVMKSVWSPDTPFTESDYTPSVSGRNPFSNHNNTTVPPVPALPAGVLDSSGINTTSKGVTGHSRNDTLDSAGTAFEEDEDLKRSHRIMSTDTVFEEDETPLREQMLDAPITIDTSLVPTPRRSQGWWNFITTPFVATPNSAVFPSHGSQERRALAVPTMPPQFGQASEPQPDPSVNRSNIDVSTPKTHDTAPPNTLITQNLTVNNTTITQPQHENPAPVPYAASANPVIGTGTRGINAVMMPLQVEKDPRTININIELQDRRPPIGAMGAQTTRANTPPTQLGYASAPTTQPAANARTNSPAQNVPVFAPPPTYAVKGSHFSYDNGRPSGSPTYAKDPKGKKQKKDKKRRKVSDMMTCFPFIKRKLQKKQQQQVKKDDQQEKKKKKKRRGWCFWGCCCCFILIILLAILVPLVVVLTRRGDKPGTGPAGTQPDQSPNSGWLNLPNLPPIPTGISTMIQPEAVTEQSGCVAPTTLWSCALPKAQQDSVKPNQPDQPNFKMQIMYDDSKKATATTKRAVNPVSAGAFIRSRLLRLRGALPLPSPAPPSDADMTLLGKTTDGNSVPYDGEETPLFITFEAPTPSAARMVKRDAKDPTNITAVIPPPLLDADGTAAAATLLPLPVAQPLRLYNRGQGNEYYGFYTYFDRSIFMKQINGTNRGGNPADVDGGSSKAAATLRCTFSQTRFLVQIWTRSSKTKPLLQRSAQNGPDAWKRPGTFPYPVTVTLDRHGGDAKKKNLYCYDMQSDGTIKDEDSNKFFVFEDRGFGGNLVDGTQGRPDITGPIDGGTGGCRCQWQNWLSYS